MIGRYQKITRGYILGEGAGPNADRQHTERIREQHGNCLASDPNHPFYLTIRRHDKISASDRLYGDLSIGSSDHRSWHKARCFTKRDRETTLVHGRIQLVHLIGAGRSSRCQMFVSDHNLGEFVSIRIGVGADRRRRICRIVLRTTFTDPDVDKRIVRAGRRNRRRHRFINVVVRCSFDLRRRQSARWDPHPNSSRASRRSPTDWSNQNGGYRSRSRLRSYKRLMRSPARHRAKAPYCPSCAHPGGGVYSAGWRADKGRPRDHPEGHQWHYSRDQQIVRIDRSGG